MPAYTLLASPNLLYEVYRYFRGQRNLLISHQSNTCGMSLDAVCKWNDQLWQMVERERRTIPQNTIRSLIDSVPRCVSSCIAARGGSTSY
ncbi:hypothetical protein TNCV_61641 [Trichonephila clavipes]|nr:hypothetical protein TNCV_61641 [Trichonephila clavipes]